MADALCGPSNALQNFQKHTTVDRTLQQDRLVGRHSPSQAFRSSPAASAAATDHEFDAFQAGQPDFQHRAPPHLAHAPRLVQAPQALPDWANDFQRMNIASPPPQQHFQQQRAQPANASSAWHQDFMRQQAPVVQAPVLQQQQAFGGMSGYGMGGFAASPYMQAPVFQNAALSDTAQGKQRAQDAVPAFDEAAFEQAFAQAQQDMFEEAVAEQTQPQPQPEQLDRPSEIDPLLMRIRETRPAVYSAIQVWSEMGLGRTDEAITFLDNMDRLEKTGHLVQDANEGRWIVDSLQRIANRDAPQEIKTRAETLITAVNQRLMSQYPLGAQVPMSAEPLWQEIDAAGYMRAAEPVPAEQKEEQQQQPLTTDDDMAATAGRLLEKVADNTSEKFKNSQFLSLMRRLRDHKVRVEDDKFVDVDAAPTPSPDKVSAPPPSIPSSSSSSFPTANPPPPTTIIPDIDPMLLNHAATDFQMPDYAQYADSPHTSTPSS
ncbi:hypothetical protein P153DRAFT_286069 [Dothidotthia symphoricarpi CBS 119687]|uniref:Peroxin 20 n=1 Tax=Dothidotthia symphoricarpi CBS 119687 TaxID=1392245 RepID=A0A6A6AJJ4_9PLEO|nr:uncharacterized protein P153DRAFT_286069 [Dothidotthia symphoricarpi CBS 119687]KAF2131393.1 hypothetical protein P153DRAFT_286069 [Dothidotthia symphoricarpi CBS 119687]